MGILKQWMEDVHVSLAQTALMDLAQVTSNVGHVVWPNDVADIVARQIRSCGTIRFCS